MGASEEEEIEDEDDDDNNQHEKIKKKISKNLSDLVNYIHAVHFNGFDDEGINTTSTSFISNYKDKGCIEREAGNYKGRELRRFKEVLYILQACNGCGIRSCKVINKLVMVN